jgi:hypothetical protein
VKERELLNWKFVQLNWNGRIIQEIKVIAALFGGLRNYKRSSIERENYRRVNRGPKKSAGEFF